MDGEFLRAMKNIDKNLARIADALEKQTAPSVDGKELFERIKGEMDKEITRRLQARNQSGQPFR